MGHNHTIGYKKGKENKVVDTLSSQFEQEESDLMILNVASTKIEPQWIEEVKSSYIDLMAQVLLTLEVNYHYTVKDGIIKYKGRILIGSSNLIKLRVMEEIHNSSIGGNSGMQASNQKAKGMFYWAGMKKEFEEYISACDVCKKCKQKMYHTLGYYSH